MKTLPRLSSRDPVLKTLNKIVAILDPFDRVAQLRILASSCVAIGDHDMAQSFLDTLKKEVVS